MTTHSWDENPNGVWTLEIENVAGASDYGKAAVLLLVYPEICSAVSSYVCPELKTVTQSKEK